MKNLLFSCLAAAWVIASAGCASDMSSTSTSSRTTYVAGSNDPKDMNTAVIPETPPPAPAPVTDQDYPSNGIHTSGNLPGMR